MTQDIFKRQDLKYVCLNEEADLLLNQLKDVLIEDSNMGEKGYYIVKSLYFDSPEYLFYNSHNNAFKQKVRLRTYDDNGINDMSFIEIKSKYRNVSIKRRMSLKLDSSYRFLLNGISPSEREIKDHNIFNEIGNLKKYYQIMPVTKIIYKRKAFFYKDIPDIRMTVDRNITSDFDDLALENNISGDLILDENRTLIELKSMYGVPLETARLINGIGLFPTSFSKYITSVTKYITAEKTLISPNVKAG